MMERPRNYISYLLRMWRSGQDEATWQASLESPLTGERQGFAGLEELWAFLQAQTDVRDNKKIQDDVRGGEKCEKSDCC